MFVDMIVRSVGITRLIWIVKYVPYTAMANETRNIWLEGEASINNPS